MRRTIPNLTLRTSFIVGFPGETEADFDELCEFRQSRRNSTGWASSATPTKTAPQPTTWATKFRRAKLNVAARS